MLTKVLTKESTMKRSLGGFKSRLFENDETTRNDVLEDISNSLTNYLDAKRVKDSYHICFQSYQISSYNYLDLRVLNLGVNFQVRVSSVLNIAYTIILYQECRHTAFVSKRRK